MSLWNLYKAYTSRYWKAPDLPSAGVRVESNAWVYMGYGLIIAGLMGLLFHTPNIPSFEELQQGDGVLQITAGRTDYYHVKVGSMRVSCSQITCGPISKEFHDEPVHVWVSGERIWQIVSGNNIVVSYRANVERAHLYRSMGSWALAIGLTMLVWGNVRQWRYWSKR